GGSGGTLPQPLARIRILQKGIRDDEQRKTAVPEGIKPGRGLQSGAKQATGRKHARKGQHPRDHDERRVEISTRYRKERTRAQDGELCEEKTSREQIGHEDRSGVGRDEGTDPPRLDGRQRPSRDGKGDEQGQHDSKGEASLRQTRRQVRENEMLFL